MNKKEGIRLLTGVLFFGSVWGMIEVLLGGFLYKQDIPRSSVILAAGALFVLSAARIWMPRRGSSTLIGVVAALYKLINAAPFICHLFGIFALGFVFDAAASLFLKEKTRIKMGTILLGPVSVLVSNLFFAVFMTYIVRYFFLGGGRIGQSAQSHLYQRRNDRTAVSFNRSRNNPLGPEGKKRLPVAMEVWF